jgi:hypothetical protein
MSRLSTPGSRLFGSQVTNTQIHPDPTFLEPYDCNRVTIDSNTLFSFIIPSVETMALHSSIMIYDDICVSYMQIHILMFDDCEAEILDSDSDVHHNSST